MLERTQMLKVMVLDVIYPDTPVLRNPGSAPDVMTNRRGSSDLQNATWNHEFFSELH